MLEEDNTNKIINKTCHFTYLRQQYETLKRFENFYEANAKHSLYQTNLDVTLY